MTAQVVVAIHGGIDTGSKYRMKVILTFVVLIQVWCAFFLSFVRALLVFIVCGVGREGLEL